MDIWVIRGGVKNGPYPDYEIRGRIAHGEMDPKSKVWHEGLAEWTEIQELELFKNEFQKETQKPPELPKEYLERAAESSEKPEKKDRPKLHLCRRFFARWFDLMVYSALWWLALYYAGRDIGDAISNAWVLLPIYIPWFAFEAWFLYKYSWTPGKWLMSLKVENEDGTGLSLKKSIWRSVRVMVTGIGFGWGLLSLVCQALSWFTARRIGKPIWDFLGNHRVKAEPIKVWRIIVVVLGFLVAAHLQMAVSGPHQKEAIIEMFPEMEEYMRDQDMWYLPVKK